MREWKVGVTRRPELAGAGARPALMPQPQKGIRSINLIQLGHSVTVFARVPDVGRVRLDSNAKRLIGSLHFVRDSEENALTQPSHFIGLEADGYEENEAIGKFEKLRSLKPPLVLLMRARIVMRDVVVRQDAPAPFPRPLPGICATFSKKDVGIGQVMIIMQADPLRA